VTVPLNMGRIHRAVHGLGDDLNLVEVDKGTLLSTKDTAIFAVGEPLTSPPQRPVRSPT